MRAMALPALGKIVGQSEKARSVEDGGRALKATHERLQDVLGCGLWQPTHAEFVDKCAWLVKRGVANSLAQLDRPRIGGKHRSRCLGPLCQGKSLSLGRP